MFFLKGRYAEHFEIESGVIAFLAFLHSLFGEFSECLDRRGTEAISRMNLRTVTLQLQKSFEKARGKAGRIWGISTVIAVMLLFMAAGFGTQETTRPNLESKEISREMRGSEDKADDAAYMQTAAKALELHASQTETTDLKSLLLKYSRDYQVPLPLVMAIMKIESSFDPNAISPAGARGLMQLMPETARHFGLVVNGVVDERTDPAKNLAAGIGYFRHLLDSFDTPIDAIAAYNMGPGLVRKRLPSNSETLQHVYKILRQKYRYEANADLMNEDMELLLQKCQRTKLAMSPRSAGNS